MGFTANFVRRRCAIAMDCSDVRASLTKILHLAGICGPFLAAWIVLSGLGGWPQNDDPFYGRPVKFYVDEARFQLVRQYGELTASSLGHIASGAAFCSLTDFSYRNLFLVCIIQQILGGIAIYAACRWLKLESWFSVIIALALCAFPLYFGHAFTFMTDGPATAWASIACCALLIGLIDSRYGWLAVASIAIAYGYWIRQTNLLICAIPVLALPILLRRGETLDFREQGMRPTAFSPKRFVGWIACLGPALVSVILLESGYVIHPSSERIDDIAPDAMSLVRLKEMVIGAYGFCLLLGWLCIPLLPWLIGEMRNASLDCQNEHVSSDGNARKLSHGQRTLSWALGIIVCIALFVPFAATSGRACITNATGAFIQNGHFGPIFLSDMDEPGRWSDLGGVSWPLWLWQFLTVLSIATCASLAWWSAWTVGQLFSDWRLGKTSDKRVTVGFALLGTIIASYVLVLVFVQPLMDRYWMFLFPPTLLWLALLASVHRWKMNGIRLAWACSWLVAMLGMSLVFTHDLLAWNNARWQFVNEQLSHGTLPHQLDAGRDVNAWLRMREDSDTSSRAGDNSKWWSGHATRCIAVGPRPGWKEVDHLPWASWATGRTHHLLVLENTDRQLPSRSASHFGVKK